MRRVKSCTTIMTFALTLALFATLPDNSLYAQQRGGRRGGGQPQPGAPGPGRGTLLPPEYDNRPFNIALEKLPSQYLGCDAEVVYTRIRNGIDNIRKGELDATQQRQAAAKQWPNLPTPPVLDLDSTYAFRFHPEERSYNTGERVLQVYCPLSRVVENGKEDDTRRALRVKYQPRVDNKYISTDARGTRVEFEELKFREYLVAFANFREFPVEKIILPSVKQAMGKNPKKDAGADLLDQGSRQESITANIHIMPADAKQLEENIAVLVVSKLVPPYITSDTVQQRFTPEKPRDYFAQRYYLTVRVLELWFYDFATGTVSMKMKAQQASQLP